MFPDQHCGPCDGDSILTCTRVLCPVYETQAFRLADLFGEISGEGRIILKGWQGGEGWCF